MDDGPSIVVLKLLAAIVVLGAEGFFAAAEIGLLGVGRIQLRRLAEEGNKRAQMVQRMFANPARLVATVLVTITTLLYIAEALATDAALDFVSAYGSGWVEFVIPTSFALIALLFAELAPVLYASAHPRKVALAAAMPVRIAGALLYPLIAFVSAVSNRLLRLLGCDPRHHRPLITEAEIITLIQMAEEQGAIAREERQMLHSALEFPDVRVGELMVRRVDMVCVPADMLLRDAVRQMVEVGHSRIPVYQGTIDEIIGILYAKDALAAWHRGERNVPVKEIARPPLFVPETQRAQSVLQTMQRQRRGMAIVLDEEGGVVGLVTTEDLVEEILGEIHDEWDVAQRLIQSLGDGEYKVDARLSIRQVEKLLDIELPEEEYDTLAEMVFEMLQRFPRVGDKLTVGNVELEVMEMQRRRIRWLKLRLQQRDVNAIGSPDANRTEQQGNASTHTGKLWSFW